MFFSAFLPKTNKTNIKAYLLTILYFSLTGWWRYQMLIPWGSRALAPSTLVFCQILRERDMEMRLRVEHSLSCSRPRWLLRQFSLSVSVYFLSCFFHVRVFFFTLDQTALLIKHSYTFTTEFMCSQQYSWHQEINTRMVSLEDDITPHSERHWFPKKERESHIPIPFYKSLWLRIGYAFRCSSLNTAIWFSSFADVTYTTARIRSNTAFASQLFP